MSVASQELSPTTNAGARWATVALRLLALGATVGVLLDAMHVRTGTTRYPTPWVFGVATWTFPLFAGAAVALGLGPHMVDRALRRPAEAMSARRVLAGMALFVVAYGASCFLRGAVCVAALALLAVGLWWVTGRRADDLAHAAVAAVGGVCVEVTLVRAGAFAHRDVALFGVASWLPLLYVSASLSVAALARRWLDGGA